MSRERRSRDEIVAEVDDLLGRLLTLTEEELSRLTEIIQEWMEIKRDEE